MIVRNMLLTSLVFGAFFIGGCRVQSSSAEFSEPGIEIHYSPNENLEAFDNRLIRSAHRSVDICAFAFTDHELAEALIAVAARGVKVRLYLDQGQTHGELAREERGGRTSRAGGTEDDGAAQMDAGVMQRLSATPNIEIRIKHSRTLMHLKSYSIDGVTLRSGSANFSPTGEKRQDNDLLLTRDRGSVERFRLNFEQLWSRADNETIAPNSPKGSETCEATPSSSLQVFLDTRVGRIDVRHPRRGNFLHFGRQVLVFVGVIEGCLLTVCCSSRDHPRGLPSLIRWFEDKMSKLYRLGILSEATYSPPKMCQGINS